MWGLDKEIKRIERQIRHVEIADDMKVVLEARLREKRRLLRALTEDFGAKPDVSAKH
jgi:hypothetical protein